MCFRKDLVYSIKCGLCDKNHRIYVGETCRPFAVRFNEHCLRSARNPDAKSYQHMAFSKHYKQLHPGQSPKLIPSMLKKTKGTLERKITEAFYIERMQPDLNSKDELQEVKGFCIYSLIFTDAGTDTKSLTLSRTLNEQKLSARTDTS